MPAILPELSPTEARILAVLVEKQHTVPDSYPMSVNALLSGCNQKTSRDPVMRLTENDALEAIDSLKSQVLVIESSGNRTMRYEQNARAVLGLSSDKLALLTVLMLRGPQTAGELRLNAERIHRFADISSVEAYLDEMADTERGAWVCRLARQPGSREARWAHCLCGPVADQTASAASPGASSPGAGKLGLNTEAMAQDIDRLRAELASQRARFDALCAHLGWTPPQD